MITTFGAIRQMILQQKNQNQNYHRYKNNEQEMQQINQVGLLYILIILIIQIIIHNKEGAPCPLTTVPSQHGATAIQRRNSPRCRARA